MNTGLATQFFEPVLSLWSSYRSFKHTPPYCKKQAYEIAYPWIEFGNTWVSREYEYVLMNIINGIDIHSLDRQKLLLKSLIERATTDCVKSGQVITKPDLNSVTLAVKLLKDKDKIGVIGQNRVLFKMLSEVDMNYIVSSEMTIGADKVTTPERILLEDIPVIMTEYTINEYISKIIHTNNVYMIKDDN